MITITSVGFQTTKAIEAGYDTNQKLSGLLGGTPEKMASRVSRLRNQGLIRAQREPERENRQDPLHYTVMDKPYEVSDKPMFGRIPDKKRPKTYRAMGEPMFDCLDGFIYPRKLQEKLEV